MATVISVGYEGRTIGDLIAVLHRHRVTKVLDVRELPLSRRKGFSKTPLSSSLEAAGIAYRHLREAGNPHRHLKANPARCLAAYTVHLKNNPEVLDLVGDEFDGRVAVLCFERAHLACHRSRLLDAVARRRSIRIVQVN